MKSCLIVKGFQFRNGGKLITDFVRGLNHTPFLIKEQKIQKKKNKK